VVGVRTGCSGMCNTRLTEVLLHGKSCSKSKAWNVLQEFVLEMNYNNLCLSLLWFPNSTGKTVCFNINK
jgi:hypothetical protein